MKKIFILLLPVLLVVGCSEDVPAAKAVTFMVYMAADNSLSDYVWQDIDDMERSEFDAASVNVIVQADFSIYADDPGCRRWQINPDGLWDGEVSSEEIADLGEIDSGSYRALTDFYNWCCGEYPAERYILSIWSHGNNWYSYSGNPNRFCIDSESGTYINIPEGDLQRAFEGFEEKPDLVIFDACYMQSAEIMAEIYTGCNYVCASLDMVPESGFPYAEIITSACRDGQSDYADLPELYVNSYKPRGSQNPLGNNNQEVCASVICTDEFDKVFLPQIVQFGELCGEPEIREEVILAREQCLEFNDLDLDIDFWQLCLWLAEQGENQVLAGWAEQLIEKTVLSADYYNYFGATMGNMSIAFPQENNMLETWPDLEVHYSELEFNQLTGWYDIFRELFDREANF